MRRLAPCILLLCITPILSAQPHTSTIAVETDGIVTDHHGNPVADATIEFIHRLYAADVSIIRGIEVVASARSDGNGHFHLAAKVPDDKTKYHYLLRAGAESFGYSCMSWDPDVVPQRRWVDPLRQRYSPTPWLILFPALTMRGTVVDSEGKPIAGAQVCDNVQPPVSTDASGAFSLQHLPDIARESFSDTISIVFRHPDFVQRKLGTDNLPPHQSDGSIRVTLEPGVLLTGVMTDSADESPLPRAGLYATATLPRGESLDTTAIADEQGRYRIRVPAEVPIRFHPFAPSDDDRHHPGQQPAQQFHAGQAATVDFSFTKSQLITGRVKLPQGTPTAEFQIYAKRADDSNDTASARLNADGAIKLTRISPGPWEVIVRQTTESRGQTTDVASANVEVAPEHDANVEITVEANQIKAVTEAPTLHGTISKPDGSPAKLARACLLPAGSDGWGATFYTELDGSFACELDPGQDYTLWTFDSTRDFAAALSVQQGINLAVLLDVKLAPTCEICGRVLDPDNKPLSGIRVFLRDVVASGSHTAHRSILHTRTNDAGEYILRGFVLPETEQDIQVEADSPWRPKVSMRSNGHKIQNLTPGSKVQGLDFRIIDTGRSIEINAEDHSSP
jgi:hypothetical protein